MFLSSVSLEKWKTNYVEDFLDKIMPMERDVMEIKHPANAEQVVIEVSALVRHE
jgi:hypothetical protein